MTRPPAGWQRLRARALARDGWTCRRCGSWAGEVDHVRPRWKGGGDSMGNLQSLCARCHRRKTRREAAERAGRPPSRMRDEWQAEIERRLSTPAQAWGGSPPDRPEPPSPEAAPRGRGGPGAGGRTP